jgi:predicted dehydrogenase
VSVVSEARTVRVGVVGCGRAARIHVGRLAALPGVSLAGLTDPDRQAAEALAAAVGGVPVYEDHQALLESAPPEVVAIFTPHRAHYRPAMDALQAGCHVFVEKPLSTNAQEAADLVNLARSRGRILGVGHQYRLSAALAEARRRLAEGQIGSPRMITATLAAPWLAQHTGPEDSWRLDPRVSGGGIVADAGDHLIDALLWTSGRRALEVAAFQSCVAAGLDVVTAAAVRLEGDVMATLAVCGVSPGPVFELTFYGEQGRLTASERRLEQAGPEGRPEEITLPEVGTHVDADYLAAVREGRPPACPGEEALETVRLLQAIVRSATAREVVAVT